MLPQDNILRVIAKFTTEQIHAANVGCPIFDSDSHRDRLARLQGQMAKGHFGDFHAIDVTSIRRDSPHLQQSIL